MKIHRHLSSSLRALAALVLALGVAGCPLQTPTFELMSSSLAVTASKGAPLVGDTITLTAMAPPGGADLTAAAWKTSDATIVSLTSTTGASVMATAVKVGTVRLSVAAGSLTGTVTITVLASVGNVDLAGPTSLAYHQQATYTATVTDAGGRTVAAAVTWVASGSVAFATPGANTGPSMRIVAMAVGPGAVTAQAGGRSAQIAVKVSATSGELVITRDDGTAIGAEVSSMDTLTVEASYQVTNEPAADAQWTSTGTCALVGSSGSTLSVKLNGMGACALTASARGMKATAAFTIVAVDGVKITGDMSPLVLGESRAYKATALSGATEVPGVAVTWTTSDAQVFDVTASGDSVTVKARGVGAASLKAATARAAAMATLTVAPTSIQITASAASVVLGSSAVVTARALGPMGVPGPFTATDGLSISGATGFSSAVVGALTADGAVTFFLTDATASSPAVTVSLGAVVSNKLSFAIATVASVVIMGPQGPVRVGSTVDFTAMALDGAGARIDGSLMATWTDTTGVYTFPAGNTLHVTANVVKLGTSAIVATIMGIASPPFASPAQPASIGMTPFSPASIAVGGKATTLVTVLDAMGAPIPGVTLAQLSLAADDATKVSFDAGAVMGSGFLFTATGLVATSPAGAAVTATWTDGMYPIMSGAIPLVVTGP